MSSVFIAPAEIRAMLASIPATFRSQEYVCAPLAWVTEQLLPWWTLYRKREGLVYRKANYNCVAFSEEFCAAVRRGAVKMDLPGAIGVGTATVVNREATMGIKASAGGHMLAVLAVSVGPAKSLLFIEPQSSEYRVFKNYHSVLDRAAF